MEQKAQRPGLWFSVEQGIVISPELIAAVDTIYGASHRIEEMLEWSPSDIEWDPLVQWLHQEINLNSSSPDETVLALQFACTDRLHGFWRITSRSSKMLDLSVRKSFGAAIRARLTMADSLRVFDEPSWLNPNWIELTNILFSCQLNPRLALKPLSDWPTSSVRNAAEQFLPELRGEPLKNILEAFSVLVEKGQLDIPCRNEKHSASQALLVWMLEGPKNVQKAWIALPRAHQRRLGEESFFSALATLWKIGASRFNRWVDCSALMVSVHERGDLQ